MTVPLRWVGAGFGPILSLFATNFSNPLELKWVSLGAGVGLICGAIRIWRSQKYDVTVPLLVGIGLVILGGFNLLGWVSL